MVEAEPSRTAGLPRSLRQGKKEYSSIRQGNKEYSSIGKHAVTDAPQENGPLVQQQQYIRKIARVFFPTLLVQHRLATE